MSEAWLLQAKGLKLGQRRKIKHCGNSPSLSIQSTVQGWRGYCHRCGESVWKARENQIALAELSQWTEARKAVTIPRLPLDASSTFTEDEPTSLLWMTWLLKGGITQSLREAYSLTWTKKYGRAILPVYTTATALETIVLRKLYKEDAGPKYLMQSSSPERSVFLSKEIRAKPGNYLFDVVIVEDALSTMRVGEYVPTGSLLGTSLGQGKLSRILSHSGQSEPRVGVWLDPDKAGAVGAAKVSHMLTLMGISNQIIRSPKDPKNLSNIEIVRRLMGDRPHPIEDYEDPARFRAS